MQAMLMPLVETPRPADFETEFVHGSGIAPALYATAVHVVGDLECDAAGDGSTPIHDALNWRYTRFGVRANDGLQAALLLNEDDTCWQAKLSTPKPDKRSGKQRKYETPIGNGARAFLPAVPTAIRQRVGQRRGVTIPDDVGFWDWVAAHPQIPIVLTEGGKKALAALSQGYVTIAIYGVNAGVSKYERIGGEKLRRLKPELIPDLQRFAVPGRPCILAFDQDEKPTTRCKVAAALADLSWHLEQAGSVVHIASWDGQQGTCKGLDDLIVQAGSEAWQAAYDTAIPANQWRIQQDLARQVKRPPDWQIGDREFAEVADQLPTSGLVVLHGGKGSGKSKAIGTLLRGRQWLSSTPLVSLGRDQAESWNGVFINDGDLVGEHLLRDGEPVDGASVCIPSLLKVQRVKHEVLVVDETSAHLEFLLNSPLANQQGMRPLLLAEHHRQAQAADLVILADADLTEEAIQYYEAITGHRAYLVRSDRQALTYPATVLDCPQKPAIALLLQRFDALAAGQLIYINTDSKALAHSLATLLTGQGIQSMLITADTSGGTDEARFLSSKGAMIPELLLAGVRVIISSPTITQGFSIEQHTDQVDSVWGFYKGGSIPVHSMAQSLDRVRSNQVPRFVHVAKQGSAYSKLSKAQSIQAFLKEFKQISTATVRLAHHSLSPEAIVKAEGIDWQSQNLQMLAALEVRRNRGMVALRDTLMALLRHEGKPVQLLKPTITQAEAQTAGAALKAARQQVQLTQAKAVANAELIDEAQAKQLASQTEALTPAQRLSLTRWQLQKFYQLETVDADAVLFDRNGATQHQIRHLEAALSHATATERSASSINRNADTPQDWDKSAVQCWLLEQAGMTQLIAQIVTGEVTGLTRDLTQPIAQFIRDHATEFRLGFGFRKIGSMSDQQIIGVLLNSCGIKTKRHRRRGTYSIDQDQLAVLLSVLKRRQQSDPHPSINDRETGVWIDVESPENQSFGQRIPTPAVVISRPLVATGRNGPGDGASLSA